MFKPKQQRLTNKPRWAWLCLGWCHSGSCSQDRWFDVSNKPQQSKYAQRYKNGKISERDGAIKLIIVQIPECSAQLWCTYSWIIEVLNRGIVPLSWLLLIYLRVIRFKSKFRSHISQRRFEERDRSSQLIGTQIAEKTNESANQKQANEHGANQKVRFDWLSSGIVPLNEFNPKYLKRSAGQIQQSEAYRLTTLGMLKFGMLPLRRLLLRPLIWCQQ